MRGLALCLVAGALVVAGCGSDDGGSANAPTQETVASSGGAVAGSAGVAAQGKATPATLCAAEGRKKVSGKAPFGQCVAGLNKLKSGKAKNPASACKSLSKKKTKGTRGKSPYAVCVKAAAKLMAAKTQRGKGGSKKGGSSKGGGSSDSSDDDEDSDDSSEGSDTTAGGSDARGNGLICRDSKGKEVDLDDPDLEECDDLPGSGSSADDDADASSSDDSSDDESSSDDE